METRVTTIVMCPSPAQASSQSRGLRRDHSAIPAELKQNGEDQHIPRHLPRERGRLFARRVGTTEGTILARSTAV